MLEHLDLHHGGIVLAHDGISVGARRETARQTAELVPLLVQRARELGLEPGPLTPDWPTPIPLGTQSASAIAHCEPGEVLLGGGFSVSDFTSVSDNKRIFFGGFPVPQQWLVNAIRTNPNASDGFVTAHAQCAVIGS